MMQRRKIIWFTAGMFLLLLLGGLWARRALGIYPVFSFQQLGRPTLHAPPGFEVSLFAAGLEGPRHIAFGPDGRLYVAERGANRIVALMQAGGETAQVRIFAEGLDRPNSLVFHEGSWFIGVQRGVVRLTDSDGDGRADEQVALFDHYTPGSHNTRTALFLPDGRLVVAMGSSCNVCEEIDPQRAAITVFDYPDMSSGRLFAGGLRNAVGLAVHPETGALWAVDNGRDLMGDDLPPESLFVVVEGGNHGWPFCHAGRIEDPDMGFPGACEGVVKPVLEMQAHSAPLSLAFYTGTSFPEPLHGDLFITFHGSWNRSVPTGYKVVRVPLGNGAVAGPPDDFVWGFLEGRTVSGRPVGLAVGPDGALYISDDLGGSIFRVAYRGE